MKGGIGNIMKQAQEMQANMEKVKKELAKTEVTTFGIPISSPL